MTDIYIWFAEPKSIYGSDGERFIRAWTDDPTKVASLRDAIGKEPTRYLLAITAPAVEKEPTLRQFRWVSPTGETSDWQDTGPDEIAHLNNYPPSRGGRYEFRDLYAAPPAQTADMRAMTLEEAALVCDQLWTRAGDADECADAIRALLKDKS